MREPSPEPVRRKEIKKKVEQTLPLIWNTDIPNTLKLALLENLKKIIIVSAPTGFGKTVLVCYLLALINQISAEEGINITCIALMPFRVSIKEMFGYLGKLFPNLHFGYAMRGDSRISPKDNCRIMTVGYWLEQFFSQYREKGLPQERLCIMVDEAHDATWQTDLALRMLLWAQAKGSPIQIIVSSATLDISETTKTLKDETLIFSVDNKEPNVDIIFLDHYLQTINRGKITPECLKEMAKTLKNVHGKTQTGDILIMLPGQEEIDSFIQIIEKDSQFKDVAIRPLYSQLQANEIKLAIDVDSEGKRKFIISTNIVENAITIDNLSCVIDSGLRKVNKICENGISQLVIEPAAQSNLKQSFGRVGRQGSRGTAYLMMPSYEFDYRKKYAENEVHNNPLYLQIIKLAHNKLPIKEILSHVSPHRIEMDTKFLVKHGALEYGEDKDTIFVTELGKIMAHLPLSIRASHFLAYIVKNMSFDDNTLYIACVIASWIDSKSSIFFKPSRKPNEDKEVYESRLEDILELQKDFCKKDCVGTMLNVWFSSWAIPDKYKGGFHGWCKDKGIFDRTLKDMNNDVNHIIRALSEIGCIVHVPTVLQCEAILEDLYVPIGNIIPAIEIAFVDWVFVKHPYLDEYYGTNLFSSDKYNIDRNAQTREHDKCIALGLRRISPNRIVLSNIVNLPKQIESIETDIL